jgi:hypothetical protein
MRIKTLVVCALGAGALFVGGCGPDTSDSGTTTGGGASAGAGANAGNGDRDACLIGTWNVDVNDMAAQAASITSQPGARGSATGTIVLTFGDKMTITYTTMAITTPISGAEMISTPLSREPRATTGSPRTASSRGIKHGHSEHAARVGGQTIPMTAMPFQGASTSQGNLDYTCSGTGHIHQSQRHLEVLDLTGADRPSRTTSSGALSASAHARGMARPVWVRPANATSPAGQVPQ